MPGSQPKRPERHQEKATPELKKAERGLLLALNSLKLRLSSPRTVPEKPTQKA